MSKKLTLAMVLVVAITALPAWADEKKVAPPADLLKGATWQYSTDAGKTFSTKLPIIKAETTVSVLSRIEFDVAETKPFVVLELTHGLPVRLRHKPKFTLNAKPVVGPIKGMYYRTIPAIDAKLLKKGANSLAVAITIKNVSRGKHKAKDVTMYALKKKMSLAALEPKHLKIQTGPILGAFGKDYFTVTCRTNMPVAVILSWHWRNFPQTVTGLPKYTKTSTTSLIHRFRIPRPEGAPRRIGPLSVFYTLRARRDDFSIATGVASVGLPKPGRYLRFVAMGDSRTHVKKWTKVAAAVVKAKSELIVFSGDMVNRGRNDWQWDDEFFTPAKKLFATIPFYAVIGNHEENAPLYPQLFYTPSKDGLSKNWSQEINGVLMIGIDGQEDFSAGRRNGKWLKKTLADSKAKFIFFFTHYPAWTSSNHGRLDKKTGRPREMAVRQGQDVLVPLLTKHKATAFICGHDHVYERSELPGGLTHVIAGGAGAPLRGKAKQAEKQNPYSKVFISKLHYCLFEVKGDECTMKAITPEGKVIDTRVWKARK